jgi:hypothetical protein
MNTSQSVAKADTVIRKGHKFRMPSGSVWEVTRTRPGGIVELFNRAECRSADRYHREVIQWERVS